MKIRYALLAAALALALTGCQAEEPTGTAPLPPEPSPTAGVPLRMPPELPSPEELLARQPVDDTHDAFLVDTGGKLGTLLVTAEKGEQDRDTEFGDYHTTLSVWNPGDMDAPLQTMAVLVEDMAFGHHEVVDANFDGYVDFSVLYNMGNAARYWYLWVWDESAGQFAEVPEYREISLPRRNPETEIIDGWARNSGGGDGVTTFHCWENGKLVCVRRIETGYDYENGVVEFEMGNEVTHFPSWIKVEDRVGGELAEVYYKEFPPKEDFFDEQAKWEHLDYHGEN